MLSRSEICCNELWCDNEFFSTCGFRIPEESERPCVCVLRQKLYPIEQKVLLHIPLSPVSHANSSNTQYDQPTMKKKKPGNGENCQRRQRRIIFGTCTLRGRGVRVFNNVVGHNRSCYSHMRRMGWVLRSDHHRQHHRMQLQEEQGLDHDACPCNLHQLGLR